MRAGVALGWLLLVFWGLNLLATRPVFVLDAIHYTSGHNFPFNPVGGNPNQDFGTVTVELDNPIPKRRKIEGA